jgi:hypothetical protein
MVAIVLLAKDNATIKYSQQLKTPNNTNPTTITQSQTTGYARLNIMPQTNKFAPLSF